MSLLKPAVAAQPRANVVVPVLHSLVHDVSAVRLSLPADLSSPDHRALVMRMVRYKNNIKNVITYKIIKKKFIT